MTENYPTGLTELDATFGGLRRGELTVMLVFFLAAASWILRPQFVDIGQMLAWWGSFDFGPAVGEGGGPLRFAPLAAWLLAPFAMLAQLSDTGIAIAACASGVYLADVRPKLLEIQGKSR